MDGFIQVLNNMLKKFWPHLFSTALILSCTEDAEIIPLGLDYFPINVGEFRVYDVMETTYVDKVETIENYQFRESFYDSIESENEVTFLMRIERRSTELENWVSIESIAIRQTTTNLDYREANISLIKMSYPVLASRMWDGNAQNQNPSQSYRYEELDENDDIFDQSEHIKVILSDLPANIVERDERFEIYARGIGLVERNFVEIDFCQSNCNGQVNLRENGRILVQKLMEHGNEYE